MQFLGFLAPLLCLVALVGFVWLVVVAFRHSVAWGLLVLFLSPITAVIFAIKNWEESKRPFLIYFGSASASLAIMFATLAWFAGSAAMAMSEATTEMQVQTQMPPMQQPMRPGTQPVQAEAAGGGDAAQPAAATVQDAAGSREPAAAEDPAAAMPPILREMTASDAPPARPRRPSGTIDDEGYVPLREAGRHVGEMVRIMERGGIEHHGRLAAVDQRTFTLERTIAYGTFSVEIPAADVESMQLVAYR